MKVSVVVPIYNRSHFFRPLCTALESQTFHDWELIFIDDGSDADLSNLLRPNIPGGRVKYERFSHAGIGESRNRGIAVANGKYLAMLDSDDTWEASFLSTCVHFLDKHPDLHAVRTAQSEIDADGNFVRNRSPELVAWDGIDGGVKFKIFDGLRYVLEEPTGQNQLSSFLFRRDILTRCNVSAVAFMEDWDLLVQFARRGGTRIGFIGSAQSNYRVYSKDVKTLPSPATLEQTVRMISSHRFVEAWEKKIQIRVMADIREWIAFGYLASGHRIRAARALTGALRGGISSRRVYCLLKIISPWSAMFLKNIVDKVGCRSQRRVKVENQNKNRR